jgi:hypothetical protein
VQFASSRQALSFYRRRPCLRKVILSGRFEIGFVIIEAVVVLEAGQHFIEHREGEERHGGVKYESSRDLQHL